MVCTWPRTDQCDPRGRSLACLSRIFSILPVDAGQIGVHDVAVDVDDGRDVVVGDGAELLPRVIEATLPRICTGCAAASARRREHARSRRAALAAGAA